MILLPGAPAETPCAYSLSPIFIFCSNSSSSLVHPDPLFLIFVPCPSSPSWPPIASGLRGNHSVSCAGTPPYVPSPRVCGFPPAAPPLSSTILCSLVAADLGSLIVPSAECVSEPDEISHYAFLLCSLGSQDLMLFSPDATLWRASHCLQSQLSQSSSTPVVGDLTGWRDVLCLLASCVPLDLPILTN